MTWKCNGTRIGIIILKKEEESWFQELKENYKIQCGKHRCKYKWKKEESKIYIFDFWHRCQGNSVEDNLSDKWCWSVVYPYTKIYTSTLIHKYIKINWKELLNINVRAKNTKSLEETTGKKSLWLQFRQRFLKGDTQKNH